MMENWGIFLIFPKKAVIECELLLFWKNKKNPPFVPS